MDGNEQKEKDKLLKERNGVNPLDVTKPFWARTKGKDTVTQMQYLDINVWMVHDILLKADKMTMSASVASIISFRHPTHSGSNNAPWSSRNVPLASK